MINIDCKIKKIIKKQYKKIQTKLRDKKGMNK